MNSSPILLQSISSASPSLTLRFSRSLHLSSTFAHPCCFIRKRQIAVHAIPEPSAVQRLNLVRCQNHVSKVKLTSALLTGAVCSPYFTSYLPLNLPPFSGLIPPFSSPRLPSSHFRIFSSSSSSASDKLVGEKKRDEVVRDKGEGEESKKTKEANSGNIPPASPPSSFRTVSTSFKKRLRIVDLYDKMGEEEKGAAGEWEEKRERENGAPASSSPASSFRLLDQTVTVRGWVRSVRAQKAIAFVELNDGSCLRGIQVVATEEKMGKEEFSSLVDVLCTGCSVEFDGTLIRSQGKGQSVEISSRSFSLVGDCDAALYPLQKKRHSLEFLREKAHLRARTNTMGAVSRVRNALFSSSHNFFQMNNFFWIASPLITASDCEGAGEQFCVTTLIPSSPGSTRTLPSSFPTNEKGELNWEEDFFGRPAFLTVSGQLNAEAYACALQNVYTFGPTFRAENSNTSRHLAEFWMLEPEMAFADLNDDMACASAYLKHVVSHILTHCEDDLAFFDQWVEKGLLNRLRSLAESDFLHISYDEAILILEKEQKRMKSTFQFPVSWGIDLQSEHERYLTDKFLNNRPVFVTDYPKDIKAFYMRQNEDGRTVAAMDLLVPRVGELMGGSQREERLPLLRQRMREMGLVKGGGEGEESEGGGLDWYLDLRRFGTVPHAGFGLGFERLVQFATGVENIRDVIPFPRTPGSAEF